MKTGYTLIALGLAAVSFGAKSTPAPDSGTLPDLKELKLRQAQFAPVDLKVDISALPASERECLKKILLASRVMNALFLRQLWSGNEATLLDLQRDPSPLGQARRDMFMLHMGPWDRVNGDQAFVPGVGPKPEVGSFYPGGSTKAELEAYFARLSAGERSRAQSFFTTLRRGPGKKFIIVPYSIEFEGELTIAARYLDEASALTQQPSLREFLEKRARAFRSNDYYESDVAWLEIDASIEPTIGPYEVYEDGWFNQKAAFEAVIGLRDEAESAKLVALGATLQELENNLPIDKDWKNPHLGSLAPIRVVNQLYAAGDADWGVKSAAYNLPNDEQITSEKGSKRVLLRNVQQAKFDKVLVPISKKLLSKDDQKNVSFDSFFTHILTHELAHGLGPEETKGDDHLRIRDALKDSYSILEEAKADVLGLWAMAYLVRTERLPATLKKTVYATYLASMFRSIRFGIGAAHARGTALQLNYFLDKGAVVVHEDGTFGFKSESLQEAVTELLRELVTLQATGDYAAAQKRLAEQAVIRPEVHKALDRLKGIPVDIAPRYVTAEELLR
ncbi:MAG: hypothetical protein ABIJ09_09980 [Pseudomonadota bacterium]